MSPSDEHSGRTGQRPASRSSPSREEWDQVTDPRALSLWQKIRWLFFTPAPKTEEELEAEREKQREEQRQREEREAKERRREQELTEEQRAALEMARIRKRNLQILGCLLLATLAVSGTCYWRYVVTHVSERDIARCLTKFKEGDYPRAFKYCYKAREISNPEIKYNLAQMYETGRGVPPKLFDTATNRKAALKYYEEAAAGKLLKAQIKLGNDYMTGSAIAPQNDDLAVKWLRNAARNSHEDSTEKLVSLLLKQKKIPEAVEWLKELAAGHNADAAYQLAVIFSDGQDAKPDYDLSFRYCKQAARAGHPEAEHLLALMYESGLGVSQDYSQGFIFENRASAHGSVEATYQTAVMLENGIGTDIDLSRAREYYTLAAGKGNVDAQYRLGYFFENGLGVKKDYIQAMSWYTAAANRGHAGAMVALGRMNQNGLGTAVNPGEAFYWYKKAAEEDPSPEAYFNLGMAYVNGIGTKADPQKAVEYFTQVAATGYAPAEYELGLIYYREEKFTQAASWFKKAMNRGHAFSAAYLGYMAAKGKGEPVSNYMAYFYFLVSNELYPDQTTRDNIQLIKNSLSKEQQNAAEIRAQKFIRQVRSMNSHPEHQHDISR